MQYKTDVANAIFETAVLLTSPQTGLDAPRGDGIKLRWNQLTVLWHIAWQPNISHAELLMRTGLHSPTLSKITSKLVSEGFVVTNQCENDHRVKYFCLSEAGEAYARPMFNTGDDLMAQLDTKLTDAEAVAATTLLQALIAKLHQLQAKYPGQPIVMSSLTTIALPTRSH